MSAFSLADKLATEGSQHAESLRSRCAERRLWRSQSAVLTSLLCWHLLWPHLQGSLPVPSQHAQVEVAPDGRLVQQVQEVIVGAHGCVAEADDHVLRLDTRPFGRAIRGHVPHPRAALEAIA